MTYGTDMKPVKAVLFDLDNTLFHWDPCDERGRKAAYAVLGQHAEISFEQFMVLHDTARDFLKKQLHGQASNHNRVLFFKYIVDQLKNEPHPQLILGMHERYWDAFFTGIHPHPDALEVLNTLKQKYRVALVSNHVTLPQLEKVDRLGITPFFDAIITSEEAGVEKPNAKIYELALSQVEASADEAVMIGDNPRGDIEGAHLAGLRTIFMQEFVPEDPVPASADAVAKQLADILRIIEEWS